MTGLRVLGDSEPEQVTADVTVLHPDWESMYRDNIVGIYHLVHSQGCEEGSSLQCGKPAG
jgi:hypothetical protein